MSKLTWEQVTEIRASYIKKYGTGAALARKYGVSPSTISCIVKNKIWIKEQQ